MGFSLSRFNGLGSEGNPISPHSSPVCTLTTLNSSSSILFRFVLFLSRILIPFQKVSGNGFGESLPFIRKLQEPVTSKDHVV